MPWNTDYKKFTPPMPAIDIHGPLPEGVSETDPIAHAQRRRERVAAWEWTRRFVVEAAEVPRYCPRKACKRNRACMSPKIACYDEAKEILRVEFVPRLKAAIRKMQAEPPVAGE